MPDKVIVVSSLDGSQVFAVHGGLAGAQFGHAVAFAGDINNDGFDDVVIGAPYADIAGTDAGGYYVLFGR